MSRFTRFSLILLLGLASWPAAADWLKTTEGALLETNGPWAVRRNLVVFELANGTLASLRLRDVDLEASRAATEEAKRTRTPAPPATPASDEAPVRSLTMKDIPRAAPEAEADTEKGPTAPSRYEPVQVVSWKPAEDSDVDGTEILGTLRNDGPRIVMDIRVSVSLLDEDGETLATVNAFLGEDSLAPTTTTYFRALFPGTYTYAKPVFEVHSAEIQIGCVSPIAKWVGGWGEVFAAIQGKTRPRLPPRKEAASHT